MVTIHFLQSHRGKQQLAFLEMEREGYRKMVAEVGRDGFANDYKWRWQRCDLVVVVSRV